MERFHLYPPTSLGPPSQFTPPEFLTSVAAVSLTHFLTVGPQHDLKLWQLGDPGGAAGPEEEEGEEAAAGPAPPAREVSTLECKNVMRLAAVAGRAVATTSRGPLWVLDRVEEDRMKVRARNEVETLGAFAVAFGDPSGGWFVSVGAGGGLRVWREAGEIFEGDDVCSIDGLEFGTAVSVLQRSTIVIGGFEGGIHVVSGREFVHYKSVWPGLGTVRAVAEAPEENGNVFASGGDDGKILEWDLRESQHPVGEMGLGPEITSLDVGGPGGWYVASGNPEGVQIWERRMKEKVWGRQEKAESSVWALAFCGNYLVWSGQESYDVLQIVNCSSAEAGLI